MPEQRANVVVRAGSAVAQLVGAIRRDLLLGLIQRPGEERTWIVDRLYRPVQEPTNAPRQSRLTGQPPRPLERCTPASSGSPPVAIARAGWLPRSPISTAWHSR